MYSLLDISGKNRKINGKKDQLKFKYVKKYIFEYQKKDQQHTFNQFKHKE